MCADVQLIQKNNDLLLLRTPFLFSDGDPYQIYLRELPSGNLRMTDCGHTLMQLSYDNDIDKFREGTRAKVFNEILSEMDVIENQGEFYLDCSPDELGNCLFRFGQALTKITDITFLNRARVENTFYDDLYESLTKTVDESIIIKDYICPDIPKGADYPIDYRIEGKGGRPLFLFGVPSKDKARLATIVLERLTSAHIDFESLIVFADQENLPRPDLARLSNIGGEMVSSLDAQDDFQRKLEKRIN